jgi:hypothetical protein
MAVSYQIRTFGDLTVARKLIKMADRAQDMRPAWPAIVVIAASAYERSYQQQGPGWADLRETTKKRKMKEVGFVYPIRVRKNRDKPYMTNPANLEHIGTAHTVNIRARSFTPAELHQEGTDRMVARPLIVGRHHQRLMAEAIHDALSEAYDHG